MSRKSTSFYDVMFQITSKLPWWLDIILGIIAFYLPYSFLHYKISSASSLHFLVWIVSSGACLPFFLGAFQSAKSKTKSASVDPDVLQNRSDSWRDSDLSITGHPFELSEDSLHLLAWQRWEDVCHRFCLELNFVAGKTGFGADGGVDIILNKEGDLHPIAYVQCKAYKERKVSVKEVRELYGTMVADGVEQGIFFTTGKFTSDARTFASNLRLELIDGQNFILKVRSLSPDKQEAIRQTAFSGDYSTPFCPSCGIPMIRRVSKFGSKFWGCGKFPRCRCTLR